LPRRYAPRNDTGRQGHGGALCLPYYPIDYGITPIDYKDPSDMKHLYYVYILTNRTRTVLYTGVTNNLARRMKEHREADTRSFTSRYRVYYLIYFESYHEIKDAIAREKQIKDGSREKKRELIEAFNPDWNDLSDRL
jgi:putative endonuclease